MGTLADRRRTEILALLDSQRSLSMGELSVQLSTPEATLRKDLALLADLGLLKMLSDGAAAIPHYRSPASARSACSSTGRRKSASGRQLPA